MKPKLKKITNDLVTTDSEHPDACVFYIQYEEDMTHIMLSIKGNRPITPQEYMNALHDFVDTIKENPESLFVEEVDGMDGLH